MCRKVVLLLLAVVAAARAESPPAFVLTWGSLGSGAGQFNAPLGITLAPDGSVLVVDTANHRVQRFSATGVFLGSWGSQGGNNGQFDFPYGVAVDESNQVYIADWGNHRIQKFTAGGAFLRSWGGYGTGMGQFDQPWDLDVIPGGWVYVTDSNNHRVQAFDRNGAFMTTWGSRCEIAHGNCGEGDGLFLGPSGIATDAMGNVFVADTHNNRIQKFDAQGTFLLKWGDAWGGDTDVGTPTGLCTDMAGSVFVVAGVALIKKFDGSGNLLTQWGILGTGPGQLYGPAALVASAAGAIFIAELGNNRVSKFSTATSGVEVVAPLGTMAWLPSTNPARDQVRMQLFLPHSASVLTRVVDPRGRLVRETFASVLPAGVQLITWDGADAQGSPARSGVYYMVARSGDAQAVQRFVFFR